MDGLLATELRAPVLRWPPKPMRRWEIIAGIRRSNTAEAIAAAMAAVPPAVTSAYMRTSPSLGRNCRMGVTFTVHATKKLLDRLRQPRVDPADAEASITALGPWYATAVMWRPQVALFVNERTLLPVLLPLAPASTCSSGSR